MGILNNKTARINYAHMMSAMQYGNLSHCQRRKVGALLVSKDNRPLLSGYNGTSPGRENCCEDEAGLTKSIVHHAEANLIGNAAKNGIATDGTKIYITTSPCIDCAKLIEIAGITEVYYLDEYKSNDGIVYLKNAGVHVESVVEIFGRT